MDHNCYVEDLIYRLAINNSVCLDWEKLRAAYPDYSKKDSFRIGYYDTKQSRRYVCKTGRFLKKIAPTMSDRNVELISADINNELFAEVSTNIEVLRGEDILEAYKNCVGGGSCMTYSEAIKYLQIYGDNPKFCGLSVATVRKGNHTHTARALYWNAFEVLRGNNPTRQENDVTACTYGDRVYYQSSEARVALKEWQKNNCDYGYHFDSETPILMVPFFKVPKFWPYCDSFRSISPTEKYMSVYSFDNTYYAESTEGYLCGYAEDYVECYGCENNFNEDLMTRIDGNYYCEDCVDEYFVRCHDCNNYVDTDDSIKVSRWVSNWDATFICRHIYYYCSSCYDELCSEGSVDECTVCGDSTFTDKMQNGKCLNCVEEIVNRKVTQPTELPF